MLFGQQPGRAILLTVLLVLNVISGAITGDLKIAALRVAFQPDTSPGTSGDGTFLLSGDSLFCGKYTIDPIPHDRSYFESQFKAVNSYYTAVSHGLLTINLAESTVLPATDTGSYVLSKTMNYYHPYGQETRYDSLLTVLFKDAVTAAYAADGIDFSQYDIVVVFHAGVGQDFSLPFLDPTPEDIPSTFVDEEMITTNLQTNGINVGNSVVTEGLILPETQNHLLFPELATSFGTDISACDYQYGLTGTFSLLLGFIIGLPPLWDTETGESGIGVFGLMDQGSNNGRGLIPAPPDAWSRTFAEWESAVNAVSGSTVHLGPADIEPSRRIDINDHEYFLIENRNNRYRQGVSIDSVRLAIWKATGTYPPFVKVLIDSVAINRDVNGVITGVPGYDLGLPNSGLLIWHIDETRISTGIDGYGINNNREWRGVDLEEADGAQDIGYPSIFPFSDPSAGYFGDMWYDGNLEYLRLNPSMRGFPPEFGPYTHPNTRANNSAATYTVIDSISVAGDMMSFRVGNSFLADGFPIHDLLLYFSAEMPGSGDVVYIGGMDTLWFSPDLIQRTQFYIATGSLSDVITTGMKETVEAAVVVLDQMADSLRISAFQFEQGVMIPGWSRTLPLTAYDFVSGDDESGQVFINSDNLKFIVSRDTTSIIINDPGQVDHYATGVVSIPGEPTDSIKSEINENGNLFINDTRISSIAGQGIQVGLCDLDNSQDIEVVVLNDSGTLYAFHANGTSVAGFPQLIQDSKRFLIQQLTGDSHPEIVVQDQAGDLTILNWKGSPIYRLVNPTGGALVQTGKFGNRYSIFTSDAVWQFDGADPDVVQNSWPYHYGNSSRTRSLSIFFANTIALANDLLVKSRTYAYPNPVEEGRVKIRCEVGDADLITCEIFDIAGYFIDRLEIKNPQSENPNEMTWITRDREPGIYFANVIARKGARTENKIIKIGIIK